MNLSKFLIAAWLLVSAGHPTPDAVRARVHPAAAQGTVTITGHSFAPKVVTVQVGDTVVWKNNSGETHTATSNDGVTFDTHEINPGASASKTFTKAGTFPYYCLIHGMSMNGTVVVKAAN